MLRICAQISEIGFLTKTCSTPNHQRCDKLRWLPIQAVNAIFVLVLTHSRPTAPQQAQSAATRVNWPRLLAHLEEVVGVASSLEFRRNCVIANPGRSFGPPPAGPSPALLDQAAFMRIPRRTPSDARSSEAAQFEPGRSGSRPGQWPQRRIDPTARLRQGTFGTARCRNGCGCR